MPYTIILAATRREAVDWARQNDVPFRSIRFAQDASSLGGRFFDRIVELPSHAKRRDRFSVNAAVKRLKRVLPDIPHEVLESFTPTPPAPSPKKFSREQWLFGDVETPNPFSNAAPDAPELVSDVVEQENPLVQPGEDPIADRKDMDLNLSAEELREVGASEDEFEKFEQIDALEQKVQDDIDAADMAEAAEVEAIMIEQLGDVEADLAKMIKPAEEPKSAAAPKRKGRPVGSKNKPKTTAEVTPAVTSAAPKPESTPGVAQGAPDLDF